MSENGKSSRCARLRTLARQLGPDIAQALLEAQRAELKSWLADLTRQAERLAALNTATSATPKPDLTQGGQGGAPALNSDGLEEALRSKLGI